METRMQQKSRNGAVDWSNIRYWLITFAIPAGFVVVYAWFLIIAYGNGVLGNGLLAVSMAGGIFLLWYVLERIKRKDPGTQRLLMGILFWGALAMSVLLVWHVFGMLMHTQEEFRVFAYGPVVTVVSLSAIFGLIAGHEAVRNH